MPTARAIVTDALTEIGAYATGETVSAGDAALALGRLQHLLDAWAADELTLAVLAKIPYTLPSGAATATIGPTGADITAPRPVWVEGVNYVDPGSTPEVEVALAPQDRDSFMLNSIKGLSSSLPQQYFYQTSLTTALGTFTFWPVVDQDVDLYIYAPQASAQPTDLNTVLIGPPGYQEALLYQLALRLCQPFGRPIPPGLPDMAAGSFARMKRPNTQPGLLGVDAALVPTPGGAYNVISDTSTGWTGA